MLEGGGDVALRADVVAERLVHGFNVGRAGDAPATVSPCEPEFGRKSRFVAAGRQAALAKRHDYIEGTVIPFCTAGRFPTPSYQRLTFGKAARSTRCHSCRATQG